MIASIPNFSQWLRDLSACQPALDWVADKDFTTVWQSCDRPDWLLWILYNAEKQNIIGFPDKATIVQLATGAILAMNTEHSEELITYLNKYALGSPNLPMVVSDQCLENGYFGNAKAGADFIRNGVA